MKAKASIICLGMAVRDVVFSMHALPRKASKVTATSMQMQGGGMAATAAVAAAALGGKVTWWGRLGDDETGRSLRAELESCGVAVVSLREPRTRTPVAAVFLADDGERMLAAYRGEFNAETDWLPLADIALAQAVHADHRWPEGARALFEEAGRHRIARVLDADVGDSLIVRALLPLVDHAIFSQGALAELSGSGHSVSGIESGIESGIQADLEADLEAGLRHAAQAGAAVVGVTLGERGSRFLVDGIVHRIDAYPVIARDTNGAGDSFHGAYALAIGEGRSVIDAARFASVAAALKCRNGSGWQAAPDRAAVDTIYLTTTEDAP